LRCSASRTTPSGCWAESGASWRLKPELAMVGKGFKKATVVLGILIPSGFFLVLLWGQYQDRMQQRVRVELAALQVAVETYAHHHEGNYPANGQLNWQEALTSSANRPKLMGAALRDPFSPKGEPYRYDLSGNRRHYALWSVGPDGRVGITSVGDNGRLVGQREDDLFVLGGQK